MPVNGHCDILEFQYDDLDYFHDDEVLGLNPEATRRILAAYVKDIKGNGENTGQILRRLKQINAPIASTFVTKSSILPSLKFRLISQVPKPKTFVALSYTFGVQDDKSIRLRDIEQPRQFVLPERFRLPISDTLSQAMLREQQPAEGIWCDQLCITQKDVDEKAVSIGLLDGVYRSARMVCVAIDDVELTTKEAKGLECYGRTFADNARNEKIPHPQHKNRPTWLDNELLVPSFRMRRPVMRAAYMKLTESRWFKRAWCYHEYILSQDHCLFVKCVAKTTWVLRISALFLSRLCKLSIEIDGSNFRFSTSFTLFGDGEIQQPHVLGAWAHVATLGAEGSRYTKQELRPQTAQQDKFIIALNSASSGVSISKDAFAHVTNDPVPTETWHGRLLGSALASRLPRALSTFGEFTPRSLAQGSLS